MEKMEIAILLLSSLFWVAMPATLPVMAIPRPLCASQFNLVNYACTGLQVVPFPPPSHSHGHSHSTRSHGSSSHGHSHSTRSHGSSSHGHSHGSSSHGHSSSSSSRRSRSRERRHRHRHRSGHRHGTDAQGYCCQWLNQLDSECVCDVLVHLPVFLSRPYHQYTIVVGDACTVNFPCPGRLRP